MPLPFHIDCASPAVTLYELKDGRFQLMEQAPLPPFLPGYGYLLVEEALAEYLQELDVEGVVFEPVVVFNPVTREELRTHTRLRIRQLFWPEDLPDLCVEGLRLLVMCNQSYFASPKLKAALAASRFQYLTFSEGLSELAGKTS